MSFRRNKIRPPDEVAFPVTPFLDMAFQLLAFFILTFQSPSRETRIDLYLPSVAATLPASEKGQAKPKITQESPIDLENDLVVSAHADEKGRLIKLQLGEADVKSPEELGKRLLKYAALMEGKPLKIRLVGDDRLRYEEAARIIGECSSAKVESIRLAEPRQGGL